MIVPERAVSHVEFWPLTRVVEVTGLSKSTLYGLMKLGQFPKSSSYRFSDTRRFWLSNEIKRWQLQQLLYNPPDLEQEIDSDFDALLK